MSRASSPSVTVFSADDLQRNRDEIAAGRLWQFPGGVHPPQRKTLANQRPIERIAVPERLYVPLKQHIGQPGELLVQAGEHVLKGQPLTAPGPNSGLVVHAPSSGRVQAITDHPSAHPSALPVSTVIIETDGEDRWHERTQFDDYRHASSVELLAHIAASGIAGLGGAAFPTAQKLSSAHDLEYLIINGVECEPYIVSDDRLMREYADDIVGGIKILQHISGIEQVLIAIEDNKPEAVHAMQNACSDDPQLSVRVVPTIYPSGGERQLIQILTNRQVPANQLPKDIGILMQNVGTAYAVQRAVVHGEPLIERVVTLTGEALAHPGTVWAPLGTSVEDLLKFAGYTPHKQARIIMGGPMMGFTLPRLDVPVVKGSNCILAPAKKELPNATDEMPCIRCGACSDVCPVSLLPQQLYWFARDNDYDNLRHYNLADCIECGACAYVCPSEIPLVHYYRQAKAEMREQYIEKQKAEIAKDRFEARKLRLEREKQERLEKHRRAAEAREQALAQRESAAAQAASQESQLDAARSPNEANAAETAGDDDKQDKIKAAIARAKAKKAAQATGEPTPTAASSDTGTDDKQDRVKAAIARAKAKKTAQAAAAQKPAPTEPLPPTAADGNRSRTTTGDIAEDDKQARIKAAIERAKAKKAAQVQAIKASEHEEARPDSKPEASIDSSKSADAASDDPQGKHS